MCEVCGYGHPGAYQHRTPVLQQGNLKAHEGLMTDVDAAKHDFFLLHIHHVLIIYLMHFQLECFPMLREETERIVTSHIRDRESRAKDQVVFAYHGSLLTCLFTLQTKRSASVFAI